MQPIYITDPAWRKTFPHLVAPLPDEWLAGLLLRCDKVNGWESGTTLAHLKNASSRKQAIGVSQLIIPTWMSFDALEEWLALPRRDLLATTYLVELARCQGVLSPLPGDLSPVHSFRICPECLAQQRLLKRSFALPQVTCCPQHQVILLDTCQCGTPLQFSNQQAQPFTCITCGLDWAALPRWRLEEKCLEMERDIQSCYEFFLTKGSPELVLRAYRDVYRKLSGEVRKKSFVYITSAEQPGPIAHHSSDTIPLGPLVVDLVRYHLFSKIIYQG